MTKRLEECVFVLLICLVFVVGMFGFIRSEKSKSEAENRALTKFQHFTIDSFLDGSFQDNFENALSDQFVLSEKIRVGYGKAITLLPSFGVDRLTCENHYLTLQNSKDSKRALFNCEDYIVVLPSEIKDIVYDHLKKYNKMNVENDVYYYYIESYRNYDFEKDEKTSDYFAILSDNLKNEKGLSKLSINSYDDHKRFFYKTDHHWNYDGSYQGFLDIAKMLKIKNPAKPTGIMVSEEYAFGSHARSLKKYDILEKFTINLFNLPNFEVRINGKTGEKYNHYDEFMNHEYTYKKDMNFYAYVYGADYAEIVFDSHQDEKDNLLIISNSYSNAINELIAQYFNKTYVIDLRHYKRIFDEDFKYSEYIKKNNIQKTLVIADSGFLLSRELNQGLEL